MNLHFTGDAADLLPGIRALAPDMGVTLAETGIPVSVCHADGNALRVSFDGAAAQITYEKNVIFSARSACWRSTLPPGKPRLT